MTDLPVDTQVELRRRMVWWMIGGAMLLIMVGLFVAYIVVEQRQEKNDRLVARFVLCRELEALKAAQRADLTEKISDGETFLRVNPNGLPLPGFGFAEIRRAVDRNIRLRKRLRAYPDGCAAFARAPSNLNVEVPEVPHNEGE